MTNKGCLFVPIFFAESNQVNCMRCSWCGGYTKIDFRTFKLPEHCPHCNSKIFNNEVIKGNYHLYSIQD